MAPADKLGANGWIRASGVPALDAFLLVLSVI